MHNLLGMVLFFLGITATIALHELGHYAAARRTGMVVRRYFVGFGPTLWSTTRQGIEYGVKAFPLGGFCDIAGMTLDDAEDMPPEQRHRALILQSWWRRIVVLLAGIGVNIVLCFLLLYGLAIAGGLPNPHPDLRPRIAETTCVAPEIYATQEMPACVEAGPAQKAGLQAGDLVLAADGQPMPTFEQLRDYLSSRGGQTVTLLIERAEQQMTVPVPVYTTTRVATDGAREEAGVIGVVRALPPDLFVQASPLTAVWPAAQMTGSMMSMTVTSLGTIPAQIPAVIHSIFGAERSAETPMSVVGATRVGGELAEHSQWSLFVLLLASLNMFLAVFNVIPLPPLDGGHVALVIWEKARDGLRRLVGKAPLGPVNYRRVSPVAVAVAGLLLVLGVIVIVADVVNPVSLF